RIGVVFEALVTPRESRREAERTVSPSVVERAVEENLGELLLDETGADLRIAHDVLHRLRRNVPGAEHVERHAILDRTIETDRRAQRNRARILGPRCPGCGAARNSPLDRRRARELLGRRVVELHPADDFSGIGMANGVHRQERAVDPEAVAEDVRALRLAVLIDGPQMPVPERQIPIEPDALGLALLLPYA